MDKASNSFSFQVGEIVQISSAPSGGAQFGVILKNCEEKVYLCPLEDGGKHKDAPDALVISLEGGAYLALPESSFWYCGNGAVSKGHVAAAQLDAILRAFNRFAVGLHADHTHAARPFTPGESPVPVSGRVFGTREVETLMDASLDFWLTTGRFDEAFCAQLSAFLGTKHVLTTNSGSSANLLAVSALTSPLLGERALCPGDEVITVAAGFPTTVTPILQNGATPVFVDIDIPTYNIDPALIADAVTEKTKAIIIAHTLGNPFDLDAVLSVAEKHNLWVIEDCCDALGAEYDLPAGHALPAGPRKCGTFGHIATFSFYPAHHITMGEGGAVVTNDTTLSRILLSFRDWGRECWCKPGHDNTCKSRFTKKFELLPDGYDHKYVYSHIGYNLKITDMQAAVGVAQMERLPSFIEARGRNYAHLYNLLSQAGDALVLPEPTPRSRPSWFGMPLMLREDVGFSREDLLKHLNELKIGTRLLFGGNLTKQPAMKNQKFRVSGALDNTDKVMRQVFWVGTYPGLTADMLDYMGASILEFIQKHG